MEKNMIIVDIVWAAQTQHFTDEIDDVDVLEYEDEDGNTFEDRFDYIDTTTIPISVHFLCGTGFENRNIPLGNLSDGSLKQLYDCIER